MKGCFTSSRMFLSALVCAVSLALRTIMAWKDSEELSVYNLSTAASGAHGEAGHQDVVTVLSMKQINTHTTRLGESQADSDSTSLLAAERVKPNRTSRFEVSRRRKAQIVIFGGQPTVSGFITDFNCMAPQETH